MKTLNILRPFRERDVLEPHKNAELVQLFRRAGMRLSDERAYLLLEFLKAAGSVRGDIMELGVYKGNSAYLMADFIQSTVPDKHLYLFDTFQGTPDTMSSQDNRPRAGQYADTSVQKVRNTLAAFSGRFTLVPGFIPDSFAPYRGRATAFVHIHLNLYQSTRDALEIVYPGLAPCGIIMIEDYGLITCAGVKKATDEFCDTIGQSVIHLPSAQGVILKHE